MSAAPAIVAGAAALAAVALPGRAMARPADVIDRPRPGAGDIRRGRRPGEEVAAGELAEALAAQLRAGATLPEALGGVTPGEPLAGPLVRVTRALDRGAPLDEALRDLAVGGPPERRLLVAALLLSARHGGRAADALDGVAGTLRDRRAVTAELSAQTSQARFSAWVLMALPPIFLVLASSLDRRIPGALVTPPGAVALLVAVALEAIGFVWTRRILDGGAAAVTAADPDGSGESNRPGGGA
ncbi:MAG: type II secretion system F family protein [Microthrixaceae bacterium]